MSTDTSVKFFQNTMSGAPAVSGQANTLIAALDACLINGFGSVTLSSLEVTDNVATATRSTGHNFVDQSVILIAGATPSGLNGDQRITVVNSTTFTFITSGISNQTATGTITAKMAPLGWESVYTAANQAVYRPTVVSALGGYLKLNDSATTYATCTGYEPGSMTDINTGTLFSTKYLLKSSTANSTARAWTVVGDQALLLIFIDVASDGYSRAFYFGDFITAHVDHYALLMAGADSSAGESIGLALSSENLSLYNNYVVGRITLQRNYAGAPGGVNGSFHAPAINYYFGRALSTAETYPSPVDTRAHLDPLAVYQGAAGSGGVYRGRLPGVYSPRHYVSNGATLQGQTFTGDGRRYRFIALGKGNTDGGAGLVAVDLTGPWS